MIRRPETVLRVQLDADLSGFVPLDRAAVMVEHGPVTIGEKTYICPVRSVGLWRARGQVQPEGFPRLEIQSKKQMKDVELVANLLLSMEIGIRGFSQDELDTAFSEREESWNEAANIKSRFMAVNACISELATKPANNPISKTRFRNQADFYSLCMALDLLLKAGNSYSASQMSQRLADFAGSVEDEDIRVSQAVYVDYFVAARSNSNDTGPRKKRTEILIHALQ